MTLTSANRLTSDNSKTDLQSYLTQDTARAQMPTLAARSDKGISVLLGYRVPDPHAGA